MPSFGPDSRKSLPSNVSVSRFSLEESMPRDCRLVTEGFFMMFHLCLWLLCFSNLIFFKVAEKFEFFRSVLASDKDTGEPYQHCEALKALNILVPQRGQWRRQGVAVTSEALKRYCNSNIVHWCAGGIDTGELFEFSPRYLDEFSKKFKIIIRHNLR